MKQYWTKYHRKGVWSIKLCNYTGKRLMLHAYKLIGAYFLAVYVLGFELAITIPKN